MIFFRMKLEQRIKKILSRNMRLNLFGTFVIPKRVVFVANSLNFLLYLTLGKIKVLKPFWSKTRTHKAKLKNYYRKQLNRKRYDLKRCRISPKCRPKNSGPPQGKRSEQKLKARKKRKLSS